MTFPNPTYKKARVQLLVNETATGNFKVVPGGQYKLHVECSGWNSGVLSLEYKGPNGTTVAWPTISVTANGLVDAINIPEGCEIRAKLATGVPSAGVYCDLVRYRRPD